MFDKHTHGRADANRTENFKDLVGPRLAEEFSSVEESLNKYGVRETVTFFGSARLKSRRDHLATSSGDIARGPSPCRFYDEAQDLSAMIASCSKAGGNGSHIATGAGPGIMEAANRGAASVGASSVGFGIKLPMEDGNNRFIPNHLSFEFKYFLIRKFHLMKRAKCFIVFPGGIGTVDEMAEALTLCQTGKIKKCPIILYGREFWSKVIDLQFMIDYGTMSKSDLGLIQYADSPEEAFELVP